mmetsp:Transcript_23034/g.67857  ORF Transcript_23034/g.67857 Transcript_23034/m.67857 type:complete len:410 (-) Transcript_23034:93-1322(-)
MEEGVGDGPPRGQGVVEGAHHEQRHAHGGQSLIRRRVHVVVLDRVEAEALARDLLVNLPDRLRLEQPLHVDCEEVVRPAGEEPARLALRLLDDAPRAALLKVARQPLGDLPVVDLGVEYAAEVLVGLGHVEGAGKGHRRVDAVHAPFVRRLLLRQGVVDYSRAVGPAHRRQHRRPGSEVGLPAAVRNSEAHVVRGPTMGGEEARRSDGRPPAGAHVEHRNVPSRICRPRRHGPHVRVLRAAAQPTGEQHKGSFIDHIAHARLAHVHGAHALVARVAVVRKMAHIYIQGQTAPIGRREELPRISHLGRCAHEASKDCLRVAIAAPYRRCPVIVRGAQAWDARQHSGRNGSVAVAVDPGCPHRLHFCDYVPAAHGSRKRSHEQFLVHHRQRKAHDVSGEVHRAQESSASNT